jgi:hypothetical protein
MGVEHMLKGHLNKKEENIKKELESKVKKFQNKDYVIRKGQTKGQVDFIPEGWYVKGGIAHRFDPILDAQRVSKYKLKSKSQKDKWRGDYNFNY